LRVRLRSGLGYQNGVDTHICVSLLEWLKGTDDETQICVSTLAKKGKTMLKPLRNHTVYENKTN
ncbi:MAG: hypothetical protein JWP58_3950, partial [Hymenobacter sp.]|nr:hypothetical protein [Hymenobacter sp.]